MKRLDVRYMHQKLLIRIAHKLRLLVHSLLPRFLTYLAPRPWTGFVECIDGAEVDLLVDVVLKRWRNVVAMIVRVTAMGMIVVSVSVAVAVAGMLVVAVRHLVLAFETRLARYKER